MEGGREQNYWPGFVDALSNVVLTLVFVLVIFVFALVMASSKVEKKAQQIIAQEEARKTQQTKDEVEESASSQQITELKQQIEQLKAQLKEHGQEANQQMLVEQQTPVKKEEKDEQLQKNENKIILNYPISVVDLDDKTSATLGHTLDMLKSKNAIGKIILRSTTGKEPYSAAKRLAYYRVLGLRNYLIGKGYASGNQISTLIVQPDKPEDGHVEILIQRP